MRAVLPSRRRTARVGVSNEAIAGGRSTVGRCQLSRRCKEENDWEFPGGSCVGEQVVDGDVREVRHQLACRRRNPRERHDHHPKLRTGLHVLSGGATRCEHFRRTWCGLRVVYTGQRNARIEGLAQRVCAPGGAQTAEGQGVIDHGPGIPRPRRVSVWAAAPPIVREGT
jgi:hypothetical protein